jgi:ribosomal protein L37AE/L43A
MPPHVKQITSAAKEIQMVYACPVCSGSLHPDNGPDFWKCEDCHSVINFSYNAKRVLKKLAAQGIVEGVAAQTTNSRYVTALAVVNEWMEHSRIGVSKDFTVWCKERLHAEERHDT